MSTSYSKWLKDSDIQDLRDVKLIEYQNEVEVSGMPLLVNGRKMLVDTGVASNIIIGATGSGKTQATVLPMLNLIARAGESVIVTDTNGEIYSRTANIFKNRGYEVVVLNFKDAKFGDSWNPLAYPYHLYKNNQKDEAIKLIEDLGHSLLHEKSTADPFWENTASNYFTGLCLGLFRDGKENEINLNSISSMITQGEEKRGITTCAKEYFERMGKDDVAYINAVGTFSAPTETKGSILSVLRQKLGVYLSREALNQMMSASTIDLDDLRNKHIIYLVLPENRPSVYSLVTAFIEQTYYALSQSSNEKRFNYVLDDFDFLTPINNFAQIITMSRAQNINFTLVTRNYRNLYENYGRDVAEKFISACVNTFYLLTDDRATAEEISIQCGHKSANERLISVDELLRINQWETVFLKMRNYPMKIKLTPNYKIDWNEEIEELSMTEREPVEIKIFDMKKVLTPSIDTPSLDKLIEQIDSKIEELEQEELNKTVIEKDIKKIEIEKDKITIYYK